MSCGNVALESWNHFEQFLFLMCEKVFRGFCQAAATNMKEQIKLTSKTTFPASLVRMAIEFCPCLEQKIIVLDIIYSNNRQLYLKNVEEGHLPGFRSCGSHFEGAITWRLQIRNSSIQTSSDVILLLLKHTESYNKNIKSTSDIIIMNVLFTIIYQNILYMSKDSDKTILLNLFKTIYPSLKAIVLKDLVNCETIWSILMNIDRFHFERAQAHAQYSLAGTLEIIGQYINRVFGVNIKYDTAVKLAQHDEWAWGTLLLYLMIMSEKKQDTIGVILSYEADTQAFFMQLISETEDNFSQILPQQPAVDQSIIRKVEEMEIYIEELKQTIKDKDDTIKNLRQDIVAMRETQDSLMQTESNLKHEQYQVMDVIGVNTLDDLVFKHSAVIRQNDQLKDLLETKDQQFKNLKQMYLQASTNLESLLTTIQDQQNFSPQQQQELERKRSTILSKRSLTYIQSIEMHCKPLLEDIAILQKRNRLLEKQIKLLYKNFKTFLKELKPCKEWGMLEDVPRIIF